MRKWPTQVSAVVANVGRELSLLKMAINKENADYPSFVLWNELEPRCQQRVAGSLELTVDHSNVKQRLGYSGRTRSLSMHFTVRQVSSSQTWWRHQMETLSALLALCEGNLPVTGRFPSQRPVTRSFDVFFDLRVNKRLSKQSRRRWFETLSRSLWRHCNEYWLFGISRTLPYRISVTSGISMSRYVIKC